MNIKSLREFKKDKQEKAEQRIAKEQSNGTPDRFPPRLTIDLSHFIADFILALDARCEAQRNQQF